jgi:hypothetical protein
MNWRLPMLYRRGRPVRRTPLTTLYLCEFYDNFGGMGGGGSHENVICGLKDLNLLFRRWKAWMIHITFIREVKMCHFHAFFYLTVLVMYLILS